MCVAVKGIQQARNRVQQQALVINLMTHRILHNVDAILNTKRHTQLLTNRLFPISQLSIHTFFIHLAVYLAFITGNNILLSLCCTKYSCTCQQNIVWSLMFLLCRGKKPRRHAEGDKSKALYQLRLHNMVKLSPEK